LGRESALEEKKIVNIAAASAEALVSAKAPDNVCSHQDCSWITKHLWIFTIKPIAREGRAVEHLAVGFRQLPNRRTLLVHHDVRRYYDIHVRMASCNSDELRNEAGVDAVIVIQKNKIVAASRPDALREVFVNRYCRVVTPEADPRVRFHERLR
jgi:hypothetical protein